jgi:hypothetical protein
MNVQQEEMRLILGMGGVALVTLFMLVAPLLADLFPVVLL